MPVNKNSVTNIAGYKFEQIKNAVDLISVYQQKCEELGLKGKNNKAQFKHFGPI